MKLHNLDNGSNNTKLACVINTIPLGVSQEAQLMCKIMLQQVWLRSHSGNNDNSSLLSLELFCRSHSYFFPIVRNATAAASLPLITATAVLKPSVH